MCEKDLFNVANRSTDHEAGLEFPIPSGVSQQSFCFQKYLAYALETLIVYRSAVKNNQTTFFEILGWLQGCLSVAEPMQL